jgi:dTDP-4-amino-4,6-dideoxygalactose transaminase
MRREMIKFLDLKAINHLHYKEIAGAMEEVLNSGWYLLGEHVLQFERQLADYLGVKHIVGVGNGLDALRLILRAYIEIGVFKEGDEIIIPANTYIATILAVTDNRLKPVLVEPDVNTYNLDISLVEKHLTERTKAIMVVHLYGRACWSDELEKLAEKYNLKLLEDNAQAEGAAILARGIGLGVQDRLNKKLLHTGSLGHAAGHSFYPGKNLGALGDAGAVSTNDDSLADVVRSIANYGSRKKYENDYQGFNSRLDELQAAVLSVKLKYLDSENRKRREIAQYYLENITNPEITLPFCPAPAIGQPDNVWHLFVIRTAQRVILQKYLTANSIQTLIHYPIPPHKQKAYSDWNGKSFPVTEMIHNEVLSLPVSQVMEYSEAEQVVSIINSYRNRRKLL